MRSEVVYKLVHRSDLWIRAVQHTDNGCAQTLGKRVTWSRRGRLENTREAFDVETAATDRSRSVVRVGLNR